MTTQEIAERLGARNGKAKCPAHDDRKESLSIKEGNDGRTLIHCFAGCKLKDIVIAMGITVRELFGENGNQQERLVVGIYDYRDETGTLLFEKVRYEPKDFRIRRPDGGSGWIWKDALKGVRRVLYKLPELVAADPGAVVFIVEGEKDADRLVARDLVATTSPFGGSKTPSEKRWSAEFNEALRNRKVAIIPDNDEVGIEFAWYIAEQLVPVAAEVRIIELPGLPPAGDVSDFFEKGGTREKLVELVEAAAQLTDLKVDLRKSQYAARDTARTAATMGTSAKRQNQADVLVGLALKDTTLFHDDETAFATIDRGDHKETWTLQSRRFRLHLRRLYYEAHGRIPDEKSCRAAIDTLSGKALFDGPQEQVHVRVAEHEGAVHLDLGDHRWRAVEIRKAGWRVVEAPAVKFRRPRGMAALPEPQKGGSINDLRPFLNVASDDDFTLTVGWLHAALRGCGPYPVLVLHGQQGCGKSTRAWVCRGLVDPNVAPLRRKPRNEEDLMIAANNGHIVALDNLSYLPTWLSDALCVLATGGGLGKRELYSDTEEIILNAVRPIILNGIEEIATRGDLLDRSILSYLPEIPEEERREEKKFRAAYEAARPRVLGALCDGVATALRRETSAALDRLPRMADFAVWATAAEPAFGWPKGRFLDAYVNNRNDASALAIEASAVAGEVQKLELPFEGTAEKLLENLNGKISKEAKNGRAWPADATRLSGALRRIAPSLREVGILVEFLPREGSRRPIRISPVSPSQPKTASSVSQRPPQNNPGDADDARTPISGIGDEDWGEA